MSKGVFENGANLTQFYERFMRIEHEEIIDLCPRDFVRFRSTAASANAARCAAGGHACRATTAAR